MSLSVTLIGHYPPPYGGVASLMVQMEEALRDAGCRVTIWNLGRGRPSGPHVRNLARRNRAVEVVLILGAFLRSRDDVFHYVSASFRSFPLGALCVFLGRLCGRTMVMSFVGGNFREFVESLAPVERALARRALSLCSGLVACAPDIEEVLRELVPGKPVATIPNSFPPVRSEGAPVPPDVERFLSVHSPVVCTTGAAAPEYGLDGALEAVRALASSSLPRIGFVAVLTRYGIPALEDALETQAVSEGLSGHVLIARDLPDFTALLARSDAFLRPALVDGDSISVREALQLGVPAVASDTPFRPAGTVVFRKGDPGDMAAKLGEALASGRRDPTAAREESARSLWALLEVYSSVARRRPSA
jgi:glycosyltransferase involved in cell wall biosynthesis